MRKDYKTSLVENRVYPADKVLNDDNLLYELICPEDEPVEWQDLTFRRKWFEMKIDVTGDRRTAVMLQPDSSEPPLHFNYFKNSSERKKKGGI